MEAIKTGKPTQRDVARLAGVSVATVSYVLSGKQGGCVISPATEARIRRAAEELGYRKNGEAAALSALKSEKLRLLVLSPWLYAQFSDFTYRINRVLEAADAHVEYRNYTQGEVKRALSATLCKKYDAVLLMGTSADDDAHLVRMRRTYPNVIPINRAVEGYAFVAGDDGDATEALCRRVDPRGYDTFAILTSCAPSTCEKQRKEGFLRVFPEGKTVSEVEARALLGGGERVLLFCTQYHPAASLLSQAVRAGKRVPEEVGILAYDIHSQIEEFLPLSLSTVDPCIEEMAKNALLHARAFARGERPAPCRIRATVRWGETAKGKKAVFAAPSP